MTLRRAAAAFSAAALLVLTGCGSASDTAENASSSEDTSESSESTESGGSGGKSDEGSDSDASADPRALTVANFASETSRAQLDAKTVHMEAEGSMEGQSVTMSGDLALGATLEDTAFSMTLSGSGIGQDVSMLLVDSVMYVPEGPDSDKYLKIDLGDQSNPMGALLAQIFNQASPSATTKAFEGAIKDFAPVGSEEIDGVTTTHYTVTVDTQKMLTKVMGKDLASLAQSSGSDMPKTLTYDIWVGDDKLPRRMQMDVVGMSMTIDYTNWGEPVDIQAPPKSQISDKDPFAGMPSPAP